jgi:hypothetical protein
VTIAAIETRYAGCRFRSRLEARWAVFFDAMKIPWQYEEQGYLLDGKPYLPDFRLQFPERTVFAEVKNAEVDEHEGEHVDLCRALSRETGLGVLLLAGAPAYRLYHLFAPEQKPDSFMAAFFHDWGAMLTVADGYWFQSVQVDEDTGVLKWAKDERGLRKSFGQGLVDAVVAARSARFEHGESGR